MATGVALGWPQSLLKVDMCLIYNEHQKHDMATGVALGWPQSLLKVDMCLIYNEQQNMIWLQERPLVVHSLCSR